MFKNWEAICQIPDTHVMWALALLDMGSDLGRKFVERFPEYFTEEKQGGPIPLSVLRQEANKGATAQGYADKYYDDLASDGACAKFDIPIQAFRGPQDYPESRREPLPAELAHLADVAGIGHIAEWGGKKVVVVENGMPEFIFVAPAELIALDR